MHSASFKHHQDMIEATQIRRPRIIIYSIFVQQKIAKKTL